SINGVGNETADSILLYALGRQEFVADAYTRRIFSRVGMVSEDATYAEMKGFFEKSSPPDLYGEMHAWIVELAKAHCRKTPVCEGCPLRDVCDTGKQY
ncbi:MAG: endonuclease, partial [Candidatus Aenigmarchaeota archaeon]|nr:endonuclease [Candidatus Aenigmarchaeota archaeon]